FASPVFVSFIPLIVSTSSFSFSRLRPPPLSTLFPYTTLFRSIHLKLDRWLGLEGKASDARTSRQSQSLIFWCWSHNAPMALRACGGYSAVLGRSRARRRDSCSNGQHAGPTGRRGRHRHT